LCTDFSLIIFPFFPPLRCGFFVLSKILEASHGCPPLPSPALLWPSRTLLNLFPLGRTKSTTVPGHTSSPLAWGHPKVLPPQFSVKGKSHFLCSSRPSFRFTKHSPYTPSSFLANHHSLRLSFSLSPPPLWDVTQVPPVSPPSRPPIQLRFLPVPGL